MRNVAAVLAVLTCLFSCRAARADTDVVWVPLSLVRSAVAIEDRPALLRSLEEREQRGVAMWNTGIGLTVIGTLLTGIGAGLVVNGFCVDRCGIAGSNSFVAGVALLVLGPLGVLPGVPLWAAGQAKASRTQATRLSLSSTGFGLQF